MKVRKLYTYPVKSTRGAAMASIELLESGFSNDRCVAIIDKNNRIITGRERHELITINTKLNKKDLHVSTDNGDSFSFALPYEAEVMNVSLFRNQVSGKLFSKPANTWISHFLKDDCRLLFLDKEYTTLQGKRGGRKGEKKGYADATPVHLITLSTLEYLNSKLVSKVDERNFRPNIVIDGGEPFVEDSWSIIAINECRFRVQERTNRCIFTTLDPETSKANKKLQPLTALAKIRLKMGLRPTFGIGLVPMDKGVLSTGDQVEIMERL